MHAKLLAVVAALALLGLSAPAFAAPVVFNFESVAVGTSYTSVTQTVGGITVVANRLDNGIFHIDDLMTSSNGPTSWGHATISNFWAPEVAPAATMVFTFSQPVYSASLSFGDFITTAGGDDDSPVVLTAFAGTGGAGAVLDTASIDYPMTLGLENGDADVRTLTVNGLGIYSVAIISGGYFPGSLWYDNLVVDPVPEPASLLLLGTGLVGFAARLRRRK